MTITRRKAREKKVATDLFNKMLFEFIGFESANYTHANGYVIYKPEVHELYGKLNARWRHFVSNNKSNPKRRVNYKIDAMSHTMDDHIMRHRKHTYTEYLKKYTLNAYALQLTDQEAQEAFDLKINPEDNARLIALKKYHMHLIEIPDINYKVSIPECMDELNREQFEYFAEILLQLHDKEINVDDVKTRMALKLLKVKSPANDYRKMNTSEVAAINENLFKVAELLDYFFIEEDDKVKVNLAFTRNFIGHLNVQFVRMLKKRLYGPGNGLTDISFLEYKDASLYYRQYLQANDEADLNRMIAVLYRPKNIFTGHKKKYRAEKLEKRARMVGKLPLHTRFAIYLFFMACEEFLRYGSIQIDGQEIKLHLLYEETLREKQKKQKRKYDANTGLSGVAMSLAETGIFGPIDKVFDQNLYDVLLLMYKQRVEYLNQLENS